MQLLTKTCWVVLCATSCWVLTCEPVPSSAAVISGRPLPLCKLSRAGLHCRHIWFSPSKPPCFLERKTKFDLPHAGTMHTAAAAFPTYPKRGHVLQFQLHGCHQTSAPREWHRQCLQQEAGLKGDASASPERQELGYPEFSSFLCLVSACTVQRRRFLHGEHQQEPQGFGLPGWWRHCNDKTLVPKRLFLHGTEPCPCSQWAQAVWATLSHGNRRWLLGQTISEA